MKVIRNSKYFRMPLLALLFLNIVLGDQVVLKNGDRVTGSVVKKTDKTLSIKTDQFGVITTSWDQVDSIKTDNPLTVVLQDNRQLQGTLSSSDGRVDIVTSSGTVSAAPAEILTIRDAEEERAFERLLRPGWRQLWAGTGTLGFAGTSGNAKTTTFTMGVTATRATNTDKTSLYFNAIKSSALVDGTNADTAEAIRGGVSYDHDLSPRLFVNVSNDWEYDKFQSLDLRFVIGGGLGFHAVKTARTQFDVLAGADYNHSKFSTPLTQNVAEVFVGDTYALKLNETTSLIQSFRFFDDPANAGNYRVNADIGLSTRISKWLTWNLSVSDRYLSNPVPGRKTNDFLYTTGIGITFAR
jgi:putative salt-induced outer membrane protein YdiY